MESKEKWRSGSRWWTGACSCFDFPSWDQRLCPITDLEILFNCNLDLFTSPSRSVAECEPNLHCSLFATAVIYSNSNHTAMSIRITILSLIMFLIMNTKLALPCDRQHIKKKKPYLHKSLEKDVSFIYKWYQTTKGSGKSGPNSRTRDYYTSILRRKETHQKRKKTEALLNSHHCSFSSNNPRTWRRA